MESERTKIGQIARPMSGAVPFTPRVGIIQGSVSHFPRTGDMRGPARPRSNHPLLHLSRTLVIMLASVLTGLPAAANPAPTKIAVFDFEFSDFSAGAGIAGDPADDLAQLNKATDEARQLIEQSGHYALVDTSGADKAAQSLSPADGKAVRDRALQDCNGCEAAVAEKLGADQSFVGVVSRISRMEYVVRLQIRDAHTGALALAAQSGLRMGANYSWYRGVADLIRGRLLDKS